MRPILEKIKSRGYWKIIYRPIIYKERILEPGDCKKIVERNAVLLRGWDFPHVPGRRDSDTELLPGDNYYEGWVDWAIHKELWRFYQSGQFITYRGLWEDWEKESLFPKYRDIEPGSKLGVLHTIYQVTEIYEFLSGLTSEGIYKEGIQLIIELINTNGRELWLEDPLRAPFMWARKTGAESICYAKEYSEREVKENSQEIAAKTIMHIFKRFEWEPPVDLILKDQDELLRRRRTAI